MTTDATRDRLRAELQEAEAKAWDSLSRYKFMMFGYWAGVWVHLNRAGQFKLPNPWGDLVHHAKMQMFHRAEVAKGAPPLLQTQQ